MLKKFLFALPVALSVDSVTRKFSKQLRSEAKNGEAPAEFFDNPPTSSTAYAALALSQANKAQYHLHNFFMINLQPPFLAIFTSITNFINERK